MEIKESVVTTKVTLESIDVTLYIIICILALLICVLIFLFIYFWHKWRRKANLSDTKGRFNTDDNAVGRKSIDEDGIFNKIYNKQIIQNIEAQNERERVDDKDVLLPLEDTYTMKDSFIPQTHTNISELDLKPIPMDDTQTQTENMLVEQYSFTDKILLKWRKSSIIQSETTSNFLTQDAMQKQTSYDDGVDDEESESSDTFDTYTVKEMQMNKRG